MAEIVNIDLKDGHECQLVVLNDAYTEQKIQQLSSQGFRVVQTLTREVTMWESTKDERGCNTPQQREVMRTQVCMLMARTLADPIANMQNELAQAKAETLGAKTRLANVEVAHAQEKAALEKAKTELELRVKSLMTDVADCRRSNEAQRTTVGKYERDIGKIRQAIGENEMRKILAG
jgi:hypothetical protein